MLDPELLNACTAKADRLLDLERAADQAKADYHYAIRRLHLHGGSYREIAAALGLSHQRVSQIVTADSRNWLRRWIMPTTEARRLACSFCERSSRKVAKLVAGPQVYICDACIDGIENVFESGDAAKKPVALSLVADNKTRCSFCLRRRNKGLRLAGTARDRICSECIAMAREMAKQDVQ